MDIETRQKFVLSYTLILLFELITLITIYYGGMLQYLIINNFISSSVLSYFSELTVQVVLYLLLLCQYVFIEIREKYQRYINRIEVIIIIIYQVLNYFSISSIVYIFTLQIFASLQPQKLNQKLQLALYMLSSIIQLINTQTYLVFKHTQILERFQLLESIILRIIQYFYFFFQQFLIIFDVIFLLLYLAYILFLIQIHYNQPVYPFMLIVMLELQLYIVIVQANNFRSFFGYDVQQAKYLNLHIKICEATLIGFITYVFVIKEIFGQNTFILSNFLIINYTYVKLISLNKSSPQRQNDLQNHEFKILVNCQQCNNQINHDDQIIIYRENDNIHVYHRACLQQPENPLQINGINYRINYSLQLNAIQIRGQQINPLQQTNKIKTRFILILYSIICLAILSYIYYSIHYLYDVKKQNDFYNLYRIYHTKLFLFRIYIILWILTIIYFAFEFRNKVIKYLISMISIILLLYTYGQLMIYMNQMEIRILFQSQYEYYNGTWFILASLLGTSLFVKLGFFIDSSIEYLQYCQNMTLSFFTLSCLLIWFQRPSNLAGYILKYIYLYFNAFSLIFDMVTLFDPQMMNGPVKAFYRTNYYLIMTIFVIGMGNLLLNNRYVDEERTTFCYFYLMSIITSRFLYIQIQQDNKIREENRRAQDIRNINRDNLRQYVNLDQVNRLEQNNCNMCNQQITDGQAMIISIVCNHIFHRTCCDLENNILQCNLCNRFLEIHDYLKTVY